MKLTIAEIKQIISEEIKLTLNEQNEESIVELIDSFEQKLAREPQAWNSYLEEFERLLDDGHVESFLGLLETEDWGVEMFAYMMYRNPQIFRMNAWRNRARISDGPKKGKSMITVFMSLILDQDLFPRLNHVYKALDAIGMYYGEDHDVLYGIMEAMIIDSKRRDEPKAFLKKIQPLLGEKKTMTKILMGLTSVEEQPNYDIPRTQWVFTFTFKNSRIGRTFLLEMLNAINASRRRWDIERDEMYQGILHLKYTTGE